MASESRSIDRVYWSVDGPGPTAKPSALIVKEGLTKAGFVVHDEGTLLGDGFTDGAALQDETIGTAIGGKSQRDIAADN